MEVGRRGGQFAQEGISLYRLHEKQIGGNVSQNDQSTRPQTFQHQSVGINLGNFGGSGNAMDED
jgi:hypothetical protein